MSRQIIIDTETTGMDPKTGDRIVEIGCVELVDRLLTGNHFHVYINPERDMPIGAFNIHGLSEEFLKDKPLFISIAEDFLSYVNGAELIIHNATFDMNFLDYELKRISKPTLSEQCSVIDTLLLAREMYPGQRNSLDALCRRLNIDNSKRTLHGALLDSELLAQVYLAMTGGQETLLFTDHTVKKEASGTEATLRHQTSLSNEDRKQTRVIHATYDELQKHQAFMDKITS